MSGMVGLRMNLLPPGMYGWQYGSECVKSKSFSSPCASRDAPRSEARLDSKAARITSASLRKTLRSMAQLPRVLSPWRYSRCTFCVCVSVSGPIRATDCAILNPLFIALVHPLGWFTQPASVGSMSLSPDST